LSQSKYTLGDSALGTWLLDGSWFGWLVTIEVGYCCWYAVIVVFVVADLVGVGGGINIVVVVIGVVCFGICSVC